MNSPAFQFYATDWLGSQRVTMLTLEEEGAYIRLIAYCWQHGTIPSDPAEAARLIGKGGSTLVAENVLKMFQPAKEKGRMIHDRLEQERAKQKAWRQKSSQGGLKSAKMRVKGGSRVVQPPYQPNGNIPSPSPSPSPSTITEVDVYNAYPLKVGKPKALKSILKAAKKHSFDILLEKTIAFAKARGGDLDFCPHPSTWFNQERYNDDPKTWTRNDTSKTIGAAGAKSFDRNKGTLNEGKSKQYDLAKIQAARALRDAGKPVTGTNV